MRQAIITTDTTPHYTTPANPDTSPAYTRPTTTPIATQKDWHTHTKAQGALTCTSPSDTHPNLTHAGLISFPHDISQYDPNSTTLADHIYTGIISTHLHKAITTANQHTTTFAKNHNLTNPEVTEIFYNTKHAPLLQAWRTHIDNDPTKTLKTFLSHLYLRLRVDLNRRFHSLQKVYASLLNTTYAAHTKTKKTRQSKPTTSPPTPPRPPTPTATPTHLRAQPIRCHHTRCKFLAKIRVKIPHPVPTPAATCAPCKAHAAALHLTPNLERFLLNHHIHGTPTQTDLLPFTDSPPQTSFKYWLTFFSKNYHPPHHTPHPHLHILSKAVAYTLNTFLQPHDNPFLPTNYHNSHDYYEVAH